MSLLLLSSVSGAESVATAATAQHASGTASVRILAPHDVGRSPLHPSGGRGNWLSSEEIACRPEVLPPRTPSGRQRTQADGRGEACLLKLRNYE